MDPFVIGPGNSRGIDTQRGVAYFTAGEGEVRAVLDRAYVQPGGTVLIDVLANDIGTSLQVTNAFLNSPGTDGGSVSFTATGVTFDTLTDYDYLQPGDFTQIVVTYTIQGDGGTSNGSILIQIENPPILWVDEDDTLITNQDDRALES